MPDCYDYVRRYYGVPAYVNARVRIGNREGVLVRSTTGHYVEVRFDGDRRVTGPYHCAAATYLHGETLMPRYALSPADLGDLLRLRGLRLTREADRQRQVLRASGKPGPCVPLPSVRHSFPALVRRFINKEYRG